MQVSLGKRKERSIDKEEVARRIDLVTAGVYKYLNRQLREEISKENALTIANYVLAQKTEVNPADTYRVNILTTLITLSISLKNKQFKYMRKDDIISYLDTLRKSEDLDPLHKWVGSYNEKRQRLVKFFRWLYNPNQQPIERKTPEFMKNIPKLKRKEISTYKPTDLWTKEEDLIFLRYCPNKRDKCYHTVSRDASARPHEILTIRIRDIHFNLTADKKQYAEVALSGKTGVRSIPLIDCIPYLRDWINNHPQHGNKSALLLPSLAHRTFGKKLSVKGVYAIYRRYKEEFFPKLLHDPNVPLEDKQKINDLLNKPWNPYIRRHTSLTEKSGIIKESHLKQYAGWAPNSNMHLKYIHYFGNESSGSLLEASGIIIKDKQSADILRPTTCPQCSEPNKQDSKFCAKCRMVLTYDAYSETVEEKRVKDEEVANLKVEVAAMQEAQKEILVLLKDPAKLLAVLKEN